MAFPALLLLAILLVLAVIVVLRLSNPVPSLVGRSHSTAMLPDGASDADQHLQKLADGHPGMSGVHILSSGHDAFAVRRQLAQFASRSIDAQYYIWNGDLTGRLLLHDIIAAADRGIRVRLLIDDNPTIGLDRMWSAVNSHPRIEVRLFNPFTIRRPRSFNYLTDFARINRRMHNKSLTIDSQVTVIGGRNIGDEYFDATQRMQFTDMDVVSLGPVVGDVVGQFDRYWASESAFPAELILKPPRAADLDNLRAELRHLAASKEAITYDSLTTGGNFADRLITGQLQLDWVPVQLFSDDPAKGKGQVARKKLVISGLASTLVQATSTLKVATAYFVPGRFGNAYLRRLSRSGVKVSVLTNSLASTDVAAVHAGYAKYRRRLLRSKVRLFELMPQVLGGVHDEEEKRQGKSLRLGSSRSSLHAKVFIMDEKSLFVGSFNFDPRSVYLNCEMGLLITSDVIGAAVVKQFETLANHASFEPRLGRLNRLSWHDQSSPDPVAINIEPESTWRQRLVVRIISWLPVEWLL